MNIPSQSNQLPEPEKSQLTVQSISPDKHSSQRLQIWETPLMRLGSSVLDALHGKK